ncbi:MAG: hypothetical protein F4Y11_07675 [Chloroflexi bacterium]|nr:hypothetical protein [Chloroflexota bacterium]
MRTAADGNNEVRMCILCDTERMTDAQSSIERAGETAREEAVNVLLGQLLRDRGVRSRAERRSRGDAPDIRFELPSGDVVLIECKWEDGRAELDAQLDRRMVRFPEAAARVGVLYPDWLKQADDILDELAHTPNLEWFVHSSRVQAFADPPVREGTVDQFAEQLRLLPLELEGVDRVVAAAGAIGYALDVAASELRKHARVARLIAEAIAETDDEQDKAAAQRIACLVLFNALAFQDRLAGIRDDVPSLNEVTVDDTSTLETAWRGICAEIDYVPVFELAAELVKILGYAPRPIPRLVLRPLLRVVEQTRLVEGHDLSGRLFHTLLSDAKITGAYYTSVPAATLLARLVFEDWPPNVDWADHEFPASLTVADLACGTGTLLMAVAAEAERRHEAAGGTQASELHKAMVEQALHGYDVQLSAIHFAATSLAMLNPRIEFDRMNLYVMDYGAEDGKTALGSLDFLGQDEVPVQFALSPEVAPQGAERLSGEGPQGVEAGVTARLPELDLAIMNPPFTRSVGGNLLFGSLPRDERRRLQDELSRRLKSRQATATAGLGAAFVAAVAPKLRAGEGRIALVLPATVCTGPSWAQTRALIERDFRLDTVIVSHDPERWNFSDSTDLSEALLVATRRDQPNGTGGHRTTFVNLWRNSTSVFEAGRVADAIASATPANFEDSGSTLLTVDGRHMGEALAMPEAGLNGGKWSGVQFARADLTRSAVRLLNDGELWVPGNGTVPVTLCRLGELGEIGPDRRDLWDGFERTDAITAYPMIENHDSERRNTLAVEPDKYLAPLASARPGRRLKPLNTLWPKAGRLLIAERLRLNTSRVAALCADREVLSNVFWPVKTDTQQHDKALAVWLNSSTGILTLLARRTTTEGGWVSLKKADLKRLPVLDVRQLTDDHLAALSDLFDELADASFERLPAMVDCPTRVRLDDGLAEILDVPDLLPLRRLLASEPVISNRRL